MVEGEIWDLEEDWKRIGRGLEEDWKRIGRGLEEDWKRKRKHRAASSNLKLQQQDNLNTENITSCARRPIYPTHNR